MSWRRLWIQSSRARVLPSCPLREWCIFLLLNFALVLYAILLAFFKGDLWLKPEHFNSAGNNPYDGAASLSNIRDTCYGNQVGNFLNCKTAAIDIRLELKEIFNIWKHFLEGKTLFVWCCPWWLHLSEGIHAGGNVRVCNALSWADWPGHSGKLL